MLRRYKRAFPALLEARDQMRAAVKAQLAKLKDPYLVRARLRQARVKPFSSLLAKAKRCGWGANEALTKAVDLIGVSVVCSNLEDVERTKDLILQSEGLRLVAHSLQGYIDNPKESGYRALHFGVAHRLSFHGQRLTVHCEIQIQTLLQHAWARLAHRDMYKEGEDLPEPIMKLSKRLADLLAVADQIAQDLREQVSLPREAPKARPKKAKKVSLDGVAFVYRRALRKDPSDHEVRRLARACLDFGVRLDALERKALSGTFLQQLRTAYREAAGWDTDDEALFDLVPQALAQGDKAALRLARERGREEKDDVERLWRFEVRAMLPETLDGFLEELPSMAEGELQNAADYVGALSECSWCRHGLIDEYAFTEGILEHYRVEGRDEEVLQALWDSGVETAEGGLCSSCAHALARND